MLSPFLFPLSLSTPVSSLKPSECRDLISLVLSLPSLCFSTLPGWPRSLGLLSTFLYEKIRRKHFCSVFLTFKKRKRTFLEHFLDVSTLCTNVFGLEYIMSCYYYYYLSWVDKWIGQRVILVSIKVKKLVSEDAGRGKQKTFIMMLLEWSPSNKYWVKFTRTTRSSASSTLGTTQFWDSSSRFPRCSPCNLSLEPFPSPQSIL